MAADGPELDAPASLSDRLGLPPSRGQRQAEEDVELAIQWNRAELLHEPHARGQQRVRIHRAYRRSLNRSGFAAPASPCWSAARALALSSSMAW
jgi:hypothetical protein